MGQSLKNVDMNQCPNLKFLPGSIARWRLDNLSVSVSTLVPAFEIAASDPAREQSYNKNFFWTCMAPWRNGEDVFCKFADGALPFRQSAHPG
jgi:hypothetical protein